MFRGLKMETAKRFLNHGLRAKGNQSAIRNPQSAFVCFAAQFIVLAAMLLLGFAAAAQSTNGLPPAEIEGRQLAAEILSAMPATNLTQSGTLRIHNPEGTTSIPITFTTDVRDEGRWRANYEATIPGNPGKWDSLMVIHQDSRPNQYLYFSADVGVSVRGPMNSLTQTQIMSPFAGSDFWIADLGQEFFHWPQQIVTGHETRRTRECTILESHNPNPSEGYSRVVTWIDNQTHGIIHAEAYDTDNKLLKVFDPKKVKKVNGQWELEDIEIENVQTHSRTRIRFDLTSN